MSSVRQEVCRILERPWIFWPFVILMVLSGVLSVFNLAFRLLS